MCFSQKGKSEITFHSSLKRLKFTYSEALQQAPCDLFLIFTSSKKSDL